MNHDGTEPPPRPEGEPANPPGEASAASRPQEPSLDDLRTRIDELDDRLLAVLSDRARVVQAIGRAKAGEGVPIYVPHRETALLEKVLGANPGPLPNRTIEAIFRELMSGSFALELPLRIGYLGPAGSFSHLAAVRHFGSTVELADLHAIEHVFEEVAARRCQYGFVPYENSIGGGITDTLDAFQEHEVTIYAETLVEVNHVLLANCPPDHVRRIYSKPQIFSQCRNWLARRFPEAELIPDASSSEAVRRVADLPDAAAIGSELAGRLYGVNPLFERIQDKPNNITRFLVIGRDDAQPTGTDKTSIMFVTAHRPGALVDVLTIFRDNSINLSHIEKRPSGKTNWDYTFFVDCDAHRSEEPMAQAIEEARAHCVDLTVLGSYPRARRIL